MYNLWFAGPVIMTLQLPSLLGMTLVKRKGVGMSIGSLVKNLPTYWKTGEENRDTNENILAL